MSSTPVLSPPGCALLISTNATISTDIHSKQIKDYAGLIDHISRVLRPGGMIDVMEFDFHVYDANHRRIETTTSSISAPWWPQWLAFANLAARNRGGEVDAATHIHRWISQHPAFENVVYREYWVPASHWHTNEFQRRIGSYMRDDICVSVICLRFVYFTNSSPYSVM